MEAADQGLVSRWLGITNQQFDILKAVYRLETKNTEGYPKNIRIEYGEYYKKDIKRPNLFNALRTLTNMGLLEKDPKARYRVDIAGVKKTLSLMEDNFLNEISDFKKVSTNIEAYFTEISKEPIKPYVEYIDGRHELFERITEQLETANTFYTVARFPGIAFTPLISRKGAERGRYLDVLYERCFEKKELRVVYLSALKIEYAFNYAMMAYRNKRLAKRECSIVLDNLESQVNAYENLDVRYMENPFGFDVVMAEVDEPVDFYIFVRDSKNIVIGGIYIKSPETAKRAKQRFLEVSRIAKRVRGSDGKKIINNIKRELKTRWM
ncbi:MAG: hypothetical protein V1703_03430 [Candidatus Altiarchaeota archaeon]